MCHGMKVQHLCCPPEGFGFVLASGIHSMSIKFNQKLNTDTVKAIFSFGDYRPPVHNDINMQQGHDIGSTMYCYI